MATARIDSEMWFRCSRCGHKLGRAVGSWEKTRSMPAIEIKCNSCKTINYLMVGMEKHNDNDRFSS